MSEDKQESKGDSEEGNGLQEEVSLEGNEEDCEEICGICKSGGTVYRCEEYNNWLHAICAQSTDPFLYEYCLMKKQLRERDNESDDLTGQEDSNSEDEQGNGEIEAVYSASPASSERSTDTEYNPEMKLEAAPFIIGSQSGQQLRGRRILRRNIGTKCDTSPGD